MRFGPKGLPATLAMLAMAVLATMGAPGAAQASPPLLALNVQASILATSALGPGSVCTVIVYDKNGNRTAIGVSTIGAGTVTWGSGTYGCFIWGQ